MSIRVGGVELHWVEFLGLTGYLEHARRTHRGLQLTAVDIFNLFLGQVPSDPVLTTRTQGAVLYWIMYHMVPASEAWTHATSSSQPVNPLSQLLSPAVVKVIYGSLFRPFALAQDDHHSGVHSFINGGGPLPTVLPLLPRFVHERLLVEKARLERREAAAATGVTHRGATDEDTLGLLARLPPDRAGLRPDTDWIEGWCMQTVLDRCYRRYRRIGLRAEGDELREYLQRGVAFAKQWQRLSRSLPVGGDHLPFLPFVGALGYHLSRYPSVSPPQPGEVFNQLLRQSQPGLTTRTPGAVLYWTLFHLLPSLEKPLLAKPSTPRIFSRPLQARLRPFHQNPSDPPGLRSFIHGKGLVSDILPLLPGLVRSRLAGRRTEDLDTESLRSLCPTGSEDCTDQMDTWFMQKVLKGCSQLYSELKHSGCTQIQEALLQGEAYCLYLAPPATPGAV